MAVDDYDDRPAQLGPLDKTFRDTNIVILVLFGICCGIIALALSLVGFLTAKDPKAKSNAMIVLVISGIIVALNVVWYVFLGGMAVLAGGNR
jgi:Na+/pantothenate symporter